MTAFIKRTLGTVLIPLMTTQDKELPSHVPRCFLDSLKMLNLPEALKTNELLLRPLRNNHKWIINKGKLCSQCFHTDELEWVFLGPVIAATQTLLIFCARFPRCSGNSLLQCKKKKPRIIYFYKYCK